MKSKTEINEDYIPFGKEWEAELMKIPKSAIIDLYRRKCLKSESPSIPVAGREELISYMTWLEEEPNKVMIEKIVDEYLSAHPISKVSDNDIQKASHKHAEGHSGQMYRLMKHGYNKGATDHRDGLIPISQNTNDEKK